MPPNIISLPASTTFTAAQALMSALDFANEEGLQEVLIVGYGTDDCLFVRSSRMSREGALWLAEQLKLYAMDRL